MSFPAFSETVCPLVPGRAWWIPASDIRPAPAATVENAQEAVDALGVIKAGPDSDIPIVQHAMPCICPACPIPTGEPVVQAPFKGTESPYAPGIITKGVQSGRRTTICGASRTKGDVDWVIAYDVDGAPIYPNPENPEFYLRLKGSGMWIPSDPVPFPGITLKPLPSFRHPGVDTIEVRGTAFPKTATSDIINNPLINAMTDRFGLRWNNIPLGMWYYAPMDNDPAPNIPKVCNVMKTKGDRRYESNLSGGLELKILEELPEEEAEKLNLRIAEVYKKHGLEPASDRNRSYVRVEELGKFGVNVFIEQVQGTTKGGVIPNLEDESLIEKGFVPSWEVYEAIDSDAKFTDGKSVRSMAKLFGRLGWEAGRCIAIVHRCGFDWGSYQDHSDDGFLDNAHANNICVVPHELMDLGTGEYQLLFPTDFDMSFRKEQAVDVWSRPPQPDPSFVETIFSFEFGNMLRNIGGITAAIEGIATAMWARDPKTTSARMDFIWLLRDVACWEYVHGYSNPADGHYEHNDLTLQEACEFIPEALRRTIDIVV